MNFWKGLLYAASIILNFRISKLNGSCDGVNAVRSSVRCARRGLGSNYVIMKRAYSNNDIHIVSETTVTVAERIYKMLSCSQSIFLQILIQYCGYVKFRQHLSFNAYLAPQKPSCNFPLAPKGLILIHHFF